MKIVYMACENIYSEDANDDVFSEENTEGSLNMAKILCISPVYFDPVSCSNNGMIFRW